MQRDIKPGNIIATTLPLRAAVIDFDFATWNKASRDHMKVMVRYLAPEFTTLKNAIRNLPLQHTLPNFGLSADIWSMGIAELELVHG